MSSDPGTHPEDRELFAPESEVDQVALLECSSEGENSLLTVCTVTELGHDLVEFQPFAILLDEPDFHKARIIARRRTDPHLN